MEGNRSQKASHKSEHSKDAGDKNKKGIEAILNPTVVSHERLPMLEVIFDRLIRGLSSSLRNLTSDNVEVALEGITSLRFGEHLDHITQNSLIGVFRAEEWDNSGLLIADSALSYSIVDVLLGGRKGDVPVRAEGRPYTTIERNLVERLLSVVLEELSIAFEPLTPIKFKLDRLENNPKFTSIVRPTSSSFLVKFKVQMEGRGGALDFLIPYATVEPVRHLLLEMFLGEKFGRDSIWENHLSKELYHTDITLQAILDEFSISLQHVLEWKKGSYLPLTVSPESQITLKCGESPILSGKMGQKAGWLAVSVEADYLGHKEDTHADSSN